MSSAALEAKSARACDYCVGRQARWYCAADDAFLFQECDSSVHSANTVARRHERLRLNSASSSLTPYCIPSWPHRRPRTPRHAKLNVPSTSNTTSSEDADYDDQTPHQLQLLYQVPEIMLHHDSPQQGFLNLDLDMEDFFAPDMDSFFGQESYDDLGMLVKAGEEEEEEQTLPFELIFPYNSPVAMEQKSMSLRLDYDAISSAWATQGSPWINGQRPQVTPNDFWFHSTAPTTGSSTTIRAIGCQSSNGDGGREARVSRYREKRRTRLFSKKIRYEVRKLNAEKRPRMKGRFVKRSSFNPTPSHLPLLTK